MNKKPTQEQLDAIAFAHIGGPCEMNYAITVIHNGSLSHREVATAESWEDRAHARGEALRWRRLSHGCGAVRTPEARAHPPRHGGQMVHILRRGRVGDPSVPQLDGLLHLSGKGRGAPRWRVRDHEGPHQRRRGAIPRCFDRRERRAVLRRSSRARRGFRTSSIGRGGSRSSGRGDRPVVRRMPHESISCGYDPSS